MGAKLGEGNYIITCSGREWFPAWYKRLTLQTDKGYLGIDTVKWKNYFYDLYIYIYMATVSFGEFILSCGEGARP